MRQTDITTMEKPLDDEQLLRQAKWRNLLFDKAGKRWNGISIFDSQEAAESRMAELFIESAKLKSVGRQGRTQAQEGWFYMSEYSWHMQIPVLP